ncbi:hypothetical protein LCGC14_2543780, partial [marine sediment metagenome]
VGDLHLGDSSGGTVMNLQSGNVGIGTTSPDTKLEILNSGNQLKLSFDATDNAIFAVDTAGVLTITPSGAAVSMADKNITNVGDIALDTITGDGTSIKLQAGSAGIVINEAGNDEDFRVETVGKTHAIFAEGSTNRVRFGSATGGFGALNVIESGASTSMYVVNQAAVNIANICQVVFSLQDDGPGENVYGALRIKPSSVTAGSESANFTFRTQIAGGSTVGVLSVGVAGFIHNNDGNDLDARFEGDTLEHMLFLEGNAASENIALLATALPNWQAMDRGIFIGNMTTAPTGNPTGGGFFYSLAGALKWRGSSGTVTPIAPAWYNKLWKKY